MNSECVIKLAEKLTLLPFLILQLCKNGAWLENKTHSLTFHYRDVPIEEHVALNQQVIEIVEAHGFVANRGHCSTEAKPPVQWNKGNLNEKINFIRRKKKTFLNYKIFVKGEAALYILRKLFGNDWENSVKVIFAGDDTTDEDAMKVNFAKNSTTYLLSITTTLLCEIDYNVVTFQFIVCKLHTMYQAHAIKMK